MSILNLNKFSAQDECSYYSSSKEDRSEIDCAYLSKFIRGSSIGVNIFRNKRVLDLGCGEGVYSAWIADSNLGSALEVIGIDLTEHRIRRDYERRLKNLTFLSGNFLSGDYRFEEFDIVFMNLVLHHLRFALMDTLTLIFSSLKEGGQFLVIEPNFFSPIALILHMLHKRSKNEGFISPNEIKKLLFEVGFRDVKINFFWRDKIWAKNRIFASCFCIIATK